MSYFAFLWYMICVMSVPVCLLFLLVPLDNFYSISWFSFSMEIDISIDFSLSLLTFGLFFFNMVTVCIYSGLYFRVSAGT